MNGRMELLTHSRMASFKLCRRQHKYSYEIGLRRIDDPRALRQGSAFHDGIEQLGRSAGVAAACEAVRAHYARRPDYLDEQLWDYECETILRLVCAYDWRWASAPIENVATEMKFEIELTNPATGYPTPVWRLAGKIDGIVRLEDGRLAVKETKTSGDDIGPDAPLWRRLRIDQQISLYIHAARQLGYAVDTVLYDVCRKPSIAPADVPILDGDGMKIVLDAQGERVRTATKTWRQTADKEKGYFLSTRPMSVDEWGQKLTADICERPSFYFHRQEIPRLDGDIEEFLRELWDVQQQVRQAHRDDLWYRSVGRHCQFCSYADPCSTNMRIDPAALPMGFEIVKNVHPELEESADAVLPGDARGRAPDSEGRPEGLRDAQGSEIGCERVGR